jgi:tellurite resistance protein TerC
MNTVPIDAILFLIIALAGGVFIDLFFHKSTETMKLWDASLWSIFWISTAIVFYFYLRYRMGIEYSNLFLAGYILEKSLSVDNLMIFAAIFAAFGIKDAKQHKILYYGIIGAFLFRGIFVVAGTALFHLSFWIEILFGIIVAWTGVMMLKKNNDKEVEDYSNHWSVKLTKRFIPVIPCIYGKAFILKRKTAERISQERKLKIAKNATFYATPMLLCLVCIEMSDLLFSFDSVPTVIAVTKGSFLAYASMTFAILGLRSLYFILIAAAKKLFLLEKAVAIVLFFIGFKLIYSVLLDKFHWHLIRINSTMSMFIVLGLISMGVLLSLVLPSRRKQSDISSISR